MCVGGRWQCAYGSDQYWHGSGVAAINGVLWGMRGSACCNNGAGDRSSGVEVADNTAQEGRGGGGGGFFFLALSGASPPWKGHRVRGSSPP